MLPSVVVISLSSSNRLMSTSRSGNATRKLSIGTNDWPPAIAAVVVPSWPKDALASETVLALR